MSHSFIFMDVITTQQAADLHQQEAVCTVPASIDYIQSIKKQGHDRVRQQQRQARFHFTHH